MKIALTLGVCHDADPEYDFLRHGYVPYVQRLGLTPVLVPNGIADPCAYMEALGIDALLLTGGGDIEPERYHQPRNGSDEISSLRDQIEFDLLAWAVARRMPVLGICRGIQVINVFFGGGLVQDIPSQIGTTVTHSKAEHPVRIVDAATANLLGTDQIRVNSYHHQAITQPLLAPDLDIVALSEADGIIEGVRHRTLPVLGVQWHPERPTPSTESDRRLWEDFLKGC